MGHIVTILSKRSAAVYAKDSFDRVGPLTPGSTETGQTYTAQSSPWGIDTGRAYLTAGSSHVTFNSAVSDNYAAELKLAALCATTQRLIFRATGASPLTDHWFFGKLSGTQYAISKRIAGNVTQVQAVDVVPAAGDVLRVEVRGANMVFKINGVQVHSLTDAFNQTGTGFGLFASDTVGRFDDLRVIAL